MRLAPSRRCRLGRAIVGGLALSIAGAAPGSAQPEPSRSVSDFVEVEVVNVDVWVTDRDGRHVEGLTIDDFELRQGGRLTPISHFSEIRDGRAASPTPASDSRPDSGEASHAEGNDHPEREPGTVAVYLDLTNLGLASRERLMAQLRELLPTLDVESERLVLLRQSDHLLVEAGLGSSTEEISAALERVAQEQSVTRPDIEKSLAIQQLQHEWEIAILNRNPCLIYPRRATATIQNYALPTAARLGRTVDHLIDTTRLLSGLPGAKTLVYVGDALEMNVGAEMIAFVETKCPRQTDIVRNDLPRLDDAYEELTLQANANRVTVYSLQASGLRVSAIGGVQERDVPLDRSFEVEQRGNERHGLAYVARQTGGRMIVNRNDLGEAFREIGDETRNYYSLAYTPAPDDSDRDQRIEVDVEGRHEVRYRRSFRVKTSDERMADRLQSAVHLGLMENPLEARLGAGPLRAGNEGSFVLTLHVLVPADRAVFLPQKRATKAHFTLQVLATDAENRRVDFRQLSLEYDEPATTGDETAVLDLPVELSLGGGAHVIGVAVRDDASRETSYVATSFALPEDPGPEES